MLERQLEGKAIILKEQAVMGLYEYEVYQQDEKSDLNRIARFGPLRNSISSELVWINFHLLIEKSQFFEDRKTEYSIVGIAHDTVELGENMYRCALQYCTQKARLVRARVVDLTPPRISQLENTTSFLRDIRKKAAHSQAQSSSQC